jgi:isoleucyl-tRNA synthetase
MWYPADFITESFPGQFRNWFYSMLAMAAVLDGTPPFKTIFGYAALLAEDGREMHKSWGNSIEFNEAADRIGVDVMRWLYCRHKPEGYLLFGYGRADEVRRQFLIPLWNVYSFFVTYANIDGWVPAAALSDGAEASVLDRWVLARLDEVLARVTDRLDTYDAYGAALAVEPFLDDLTNWYVRRSRRRYWKSEQDSDKAAAYATLYEVLVKLTRMLAPFVPFVSEVMYQNLVRSVDAGAPASVHHTMWPEADEALAEDGLLGGMEHTRQPVTLGHAARASANLKVRQPLSRALVHLEAGADALDADQVELVREELNVKQIEFVDSADSLLTYRVLPDNRSLGPRLGRKFPRLRAALSDLDPQATVRRVRSGLAVEVLVDGETVSIAPDEVVVREEARPGLAVSSERGVTVAIDTALTPELASEGLARDVIRRIQSLRKDAGFALDDRIVTTYMGDQALIGAVERWRDLIASETLSVDLRMEEPIEGAFSVDDSIGGHTVLLSVQRR